MSTERSTFGLNSILPSTYRDKAEAFAKCLQDKLRSLSGLDDPNEIRNGRGLLDVTPATPHGSLSKYSEEEIADSVFLQGPLAYKRRSIPERTGPPPINGRYIGSVSDRRGLSSDSEDSDEEDYLPAAENVVNRRITELQQRDTNKRLTSVNSIDSITSWCSCEDPDDDEDDELIDSLASQIKGSPTIHNPRLRNFKRKGGKAVKEEIPASAPAENDLFFDFDVECFSPVNLDEDDGGIGNVHTSQFDFGRVDVNELENENESSSVDTGQEVIDLENVSVNQEILATPSSSPSRDVHNPTEIFENPDLELLNINEIPCDIVNSSEYESDLEDGLENQVHQTGEEDLSLEDCSLAESTLRLPKKRLDGQTEGDCSDSNESHDTGFHEPFDEFEKHETETNEKGMSKEVNDSLSSCLDEIEDPTLLDCDINLHKADLSEEVVPVNIGIDLGLEVEECVVLSESQVEQIENEGLTYSIDSEQPVEGGTVSCEEVASTSMEENTENIETESSQLESDEGAACSSPDEMQRPVEKLPACGIVITGCDDDTESVISPRMKLRRCSSLKTWKTPPGTPGRKKIVRFADALGLDLADIRTFLDELPKIPKSAFEDLNFEPPPAPEVPPPTERTLIPMFQQPGAQIDFIQRVRDHKVSLESAVLSDVSLLGISGMIRVRNVSFHKSVHVRYTKDAWATFSDLQATYIPGSSDGFCDNFSFTLYGHTLSIGDRLEFAIRYECGDGQFWDSNNGINYAFQCMPRSPMPLFPPLGSSPIDSWNTFY